MEWKRGRPRSDLLYFQCYRLLVLVLRLFGSYAQSEPSQSDASSEDEPIAYGVVWRRVEEQEEQPWKDFVLGVDL